MWASGENDGPNKFSSGAWLLQASEEIDERRCWAMWPIFLKGALPVYLSLVLCSLFIPVFAS